MKIEFIQELPLAATSRGPEPKHLAFAKALKENPGMWAEYPAEVSNTTARSYASKINAGNWPMFRHGYEAATRKGTLYVRYTGGEAK